MAFRRDSIILPQGQEGLTSNEDSGYSSVPDDEASSLSYPAPSCSSVESSIAYLRSRFLCPHPAAEKARKRHLQVRRETTLIVSIHQINMSFLRTLSNYPSRNKSDDCFGSDILRHQMFSIHRAMEESAVNKMQMGATISRYAIRLDIDPIELLDFSPTLGNLLLSELDTVIPDIHLVCCQIIQQILREEKTLLTEQVRLNMRVLNIFGILGECNNHNYLHYTPSASHDRVIKRAEDDGFMETATNAVLLPTDLVCSHCNLKMPESVLDRVYSKNQTIVLECANISQAEGCFMNQITVILKDDLANTVMLGEYIQLLGRLSRVLPEEDRHAYGHGIHFEVNNVLREYRHATVPDTIAEIIYSKMRTLEGRSGLLMGGPPTYFVLLRLQRKHFCMEYQSSDRRSFSAVSIPDHDGDCNRKARIPQIRQSLHVLVIKDTFDTIVPALIASVASIKK
ncbi:hypothetical protein BGZ65_001497 [Modicella reniformis]|uniref:MCMDC2 N-terminal domain-containing protein n=1 Tax=Modicella reniformis TaxID=1440133 RepID=A0A9P6ILS4_9FUNG|nr:hypothetical protein BGZ65_001497 [Modicella reniformis]